MTDVRIVATAEDYAESFHAAVDYVARERRYIGFVQAPPVESTRAFLREIPSPLEPPSGCHFHPRCPHAMPRCKEQAPALKEIASGHLSACYLNDR